MDTKNQYLNFYKNKKVLITGNTGFKGSWLTHILLSFGADVIGYSMDAPTVPNLFSIADLSSNPHLYQVRGDVRDFEQVLSVFRERKPEIVFHLAAQPIVRDSYKDPIGTYGTNVMGTVNICEAVRQTFSVRSFLNVTTDKVYENREWEWGYRECDSLDGYDPYSNSKSCSELVTHCYRNSFFPDGRVAVSTARAGNVIGGGDFSNDRIIPDCVRALLEAKKNDIKIAEIGVRNPYSIRPYQHVLDPLFAYLMIAKRQYEDGAFAGYYNVGPDDRDCVNTGDLVTLFCNKWGGISSAAKAFWVNKAEDNAPHEANFLKLDCSKIKFTVGWKPRWHIEDAMEQTINWTRVWLEGTGSVSVRNEMDKEVEVYFEGNK